MWSLNCLGRKSGSRGSSIICGRINGADPGEQCGRCRQVDKLEMRLGSEVSRTLMKS